MSRATTVTLLVLATGCASPHRPIEAHRAEPPAAPSTRTTRMAAACSAPFRPMEPALLPAVPLDLGRNVGQLRLIGLERIDRASLPRLRTREGALLDADDVRADVKALLARGDIDDVVVRVDLIPDEGTMEVEFEIHERARVGKIFITGGDRPDTEMTVDDGDPMYTRARALSLRGWVLEKMRLDGYRHATVTMHERSSSPGTVDVCFKVALAKRDLIKSITIEGNRDLSDEQLRAMWPTEESRYNGVGKPLNDRLLERAIDTMTSAYYDRGYIDARIARPVVGYSSKGLTIIIRVEEGARYRIRSVRTVGAAILLPQLRFGRGDVFSRQQAKEHADAIKVSHELAGLHVAVVPEVVQDPVEAAVDLVFRVVARP